MNRALFPENEKGRFYTQFNLDGPMRGDYKRRMEGYAIARQHGYAWLSETEGRKAQCEQQKAAPKPRYIDEVWPRLTPKVNQRSANKARK